MWQLLTCGGDNSHVAVTQVWRGHSYGSYSHVEGTVHIWNVQGPFMYGRDIHMWQLLTCGGAVYTWNMQGLLMCGRDEP